MKPVLVTTEFRGVFFGYLDGEPNALPEKVTLKNARNCVYWSSDTKGFLGLASTGPTTNCRIGPEVPEITLYKVTSITDCTPAAQEQWELGLWK